MNHRMKAAMGWGLSLLPGGRRLHAVVQRKVTHTLPLPDKNFADRCEIALQHVRSLRAHFDRPLDELKLFEFGAGWDLIMPQVFYACGIRHQKLFDLNPLVKLDLVVNANARLSARKTVVSNDSSALFADTSKLPTLNGFDLPEALRALGIDYVAPADAASTELPDAVIDAATSSLVLEHVPPAAIRAIFKELHRIVRPGGLVSSTIDPSDHYSHGDSRVSPWNFLSYDARTWGAMNPPLLYQNRLRASEYADMITTAGFRIIEVRPTLGGSPESFEQAKAQFRSPYSEWPDAADLRTTRVQVVAVRD